MLVCAKVIAYSKCFVADNSLVPLIPEVTNTVAFVEWGNNLRNTSQLLEGKMRQFLVETYPGKRVKELKIFGTYRNLLKISLCTFPSMIFCDKPHIDATAGCSRYHYDSIASFHKLM